MATTFSTLPHDPLTQLDPLTTPTPAAVRLLRKEIYANAQAIPSTLGGGQLGHLGLIMPAAMYNTLSPTPYLLPELPPMPTYDGATAVARDAMKDAHKKAMDTYVEAHAFKNHLKAQLLKAVPTLYLSKFDDAIMGYANASPEQMVGHLIDTYGQITARELEANMERIASPWNPDTPIETVFSNGTTCRQFATEGNDPISDSAYIRILVKIFRASGVLDRAVADWERKAAAEQTLDNATTHFQRENNFRLEEQRQLKGVLQASTAITTQHPSVSTTTSSTRVDTLLESVGWGYCWTHGLCNHPSHKCIKPATGHHQDATLEQMKGGTATIWTNTKSRRIRQSRAAQNSVPSKAGGTNSTQE
jgi:hypothetical protein